MQEEVRPNVKGLLYAMLGAIAFSGKAILVKLSYTHGVNASTLIMLRMLFSLPFFLGMVAWSMRSSTTSIPRVLTKKDWMWVAFLGFIGYYFSSYLDFLGLNYVSAGLERLILYLSPSLVLGLGWLFYKRRVKAMRWWAMLLSYAGVVLVFANEFQLQGSDVLLGSVLVFFSACTYAVYMMLSEHLLKKMNSLKLVGCASVVASACCIVQFFVLMPLDAAWVDAQVLQWSLLNAVLCTVLPIFMVMKAIEMLGPALTSQVGMIGPMSTLLMGFVFLNEPLGAWTGLGTLLVLGGVFVASKFGDA